MTARSGLALLALAGMAAGCSDGPTGPAVEGGAGLRVLLPAGVPDSARVEVDLWQENAVPPPTCPTGPAAASKLRSGPDSCSVGSLTVRDLTGRTVHRVPEVPWTNRVPGWDEVADDGTPVPAGLYPVHWQCLDGGGTFSFDGHYYVAGSRAEGSCRWILWSEVRPAGSGRKLEAGPFPTLFSTLALLPPAGVPVDVFFRDRYTVAVRIPGRDVFETTVTLVDGKYTEVRVPEAPAP